MRNSYFPGECRIRTGTVSEASAACRVTVKIHPRVLLTESKTAFRAHSASWWFSNVRGHFPDCHPVMRAFYTPLCSECRRVLILFDHATYVTPYLLSFRYYIKLI